VVKSCGESRGQRAATGRATQIDWAGAEERDCFWVSDDGWSSGKSALFQPFHCASIKRQGGFGLIIVQRLLDLRRMRIRAASRVGRLWFSMPAEKVRRFPGELHRIVETKSGILVRSGFSQFDAWSCSSFCSACPRDFPTNPARGDGFHSPTNPVGTLHFFLRSCRSSVAARPKPRSPSSLGS